MGLGLDDLPGLPNPEIDDSVGGADQGSAPGEHLTMSADGVGCLLKASPSTGQGCCRPTGHTRDSPRNKELSPTPRPAVSVLLKR